MRPGARGRHAPTPSQRPRRGQRDAREDASSDPLRPTSRRPRTQRWRCRGPRSRVALLHIEPSPDRRRGVSAEHRDPDRRRRRAAYDDRASPLVRCARFFARSDVSGFCARPVARARAALRRADGQPLDLPAQPSCRAARMSDIPSRPKTGNELSQARRCRARTPAVRPGVGRGRPLSGVGVRCQARCRAGAPAVRRGRPLTGPLSGGGAR
jgi:hypothetical protein